MNTTETKLQPVTGVVLQPLVRSAVECTLEENINRAATELPEGWIIEINVEKDAGWVDLYDGHGNSVNCGDGTINEQVSQAISYAKEHTK